MPGPGPAGFSGGPAHDGAAGAERPDPLTAGAERPDPPSAIAAPAEPASAAPAVTTTAASPSIRVFRTAHLHVVGLLQ